MQDTNIEPVHKEWLVQEADAEIVDILLANLIKFNSTQVPMLQERPLIPLRYAIKNKDALVAGISGYVYLWNILHIDLLYVNESLRHQGLGHLLLSKIETEAKRLGATDVHLDTFDFQAKDFYLKYGYAIFGELKDCPKGHSRFYMHKQLNG